NPSWLSASGPSRLIAIRATPHLWIRSMASGVSNGVALGVTVVRRPSRTLSFNKSNRSGRFRGSPPVNTINGSPKERISLSNRKPSPGSQFERMPFLHRAGAAVYAGEVACLRQFPDHQKRCVIETLHIGLPDLRVFAGLRHRQ